MFLARFLCSPETQGYNTLIVAVKTIWLLAGAIVSSQMGEPAFLPESSKEVMYEDGDENIRAPPSPPDLKEYMKYEDGDLMVRVTALFHIVK